MGLAYAVIEGHLSKDAEVRSSSAGKPMANISIPHNVGKREEGKPAIWFNIKCVGNAGEAMQHGKKGDKVKINKLMPEEWTDKSGNKRLSWVAFEVELENQASNDNRQYDEPPFQDSDIPF